MPELLQGYAFPTSAAPGETIDLFLRSDQPATFDLKFSRLGREDISFVVKGFECEKQTIPTTGQWNGFGWWFTWSIRIPAGQTSGVYTMRAGNSDVWFVVKPEDIAPGATALIVPFATANAYNLGIASDREGEPPIYAVNDIYGPKWKVADRVHTVSFLRAGSMGEVAEYIPPFARWFESQMWTDADGSEIPAIDFIGYYSSLDLHENPTLLDPYDLLVLIGHDEYWSGEMREHAETFVRRGGNIISLSGNTCYRQVRFEDQTIEHPDCPPSFPDPLCVRTYRNAKMICYKDAELDPVGDPDRVTGAFVAPPVNRPPNTLLGVGFTWGGMPFGPPGTPQADREQYVVSIPFPEKHWAFRGVPGVTAGDKFGDQLLNYEVDGAALERAHDFDDEGLHYWYATGEEGTPLTFTALAIGDMRDLPAANKPCIAVLGYFVRNGTVFTVSTTQWARRLMSAGRDNDVTRIITANAINRLKVRNHWSEWEIIGTSRNSVSMTATGGRLYLISSDDASSAGGEKALWRRHPLGADIPWAPLTLEASAKTVFDTDVTCLATVGARLFGASADGRIWHVDITNEKAVVLRELTTVREELRSGLRALAGSGGLLYGMDGEGRLCRASPGSERDAVITWRPMIASGTSSCDSGVISALPEICAMTSYADALYAATTEGMLFRTNGEYITESDKWVPLGLSPGGEGKKTTGLAVIEAMLFAAVANSASSTEGQLAWKSLRPLRIARNWCRP